MGLGLTIMSTVLWGQIISKWAYYTTHRATTDSVQRRKEATDAEIRRNVSAVYELQGSSVYGPLYTATISDCKHFSLSVKSTLNTSCRLHHRFQFQITNELSFSPPHYNKSPKSDTAISSGGSRFVIRDLGQSPAKGRSLQGLRAHAPSRFLFFFSFFFK